MLRVEEGFGFTRERGGFMVYGFTVLGGQGFRV